MDQDDRVNGGSQLSLNEKVLLILLVALLVIPCLGCLMLLWND
ncbi:hypothetical protein [Micromonospora sp. M61]|nr:hypothetical protein [Micromonospora sp. M61]